MRNALFIFVPVAALTLGAVGGWHWWNVLHFLQSTDDGYVPSDVSVISPKVEGFIKKVKVTDNQEVAEGAVLFVIEDGDFRPRLPTGRRPWRSAKRRSRAMTPASSCSSR